MLRLCIIDIKFKCCVILYTIIRWLWDTMDHFEIGSKRFHVGVYNLLVNILQKERELIDQIPLSH